MTMLGLMLAAGMLTKVFVGILIAVHFLLCLFLIAVVLLQSGKAGDLSSAFGGGGGSQANVAAMSSENILTRATKISAFGFMLTSLLLALFAHGDSGADSVLDIVEDESAVEGEAEPGTDASDEGAATDAPAPAEGDAAPAAEETPAPAETPTETPAPDETPAETPSPAGDDG